jgi:hypothetical protein
MAILLPGTSPASFASHFDLLEPPQADRGNLRANSRVEHGALRARFEQGTEGTIQVRDNEWRTHAMKNLACTLALAAVIGLIAGPASLAADDQAQNTQKSTPMDDHPAAQVMQDMSRLVGSWQHQLRSGKQLSEREARRIAGQMKEMSDMMQDMSAMFGNARPAGSMQSGGMMSGHRGMTDGQAGQAMMGELPRMMSSDMRARMAQMHERMQEMMGPTNG